MVGINKTSVIIVKARLKPFYTAHTADIMKTAAGIRISKINMALPVSIIAFGKR